ncbi:MAG: hypothetical protein WD066_01065 [Planctomycetaceae bacterium]
MHDANSRIRWMPAFAGMTRGLASPNRQYGTWSYCHFFATFALFCSERIEQKGAKAAKRNLAKRDANPRVLTNPLEPIPLDPIFLSSNSLSRSLPFAATRIS